MIVLDSSFIIAYHNIGDVHHAAAARAMVHLAAGEWGEAVLLEYVFLEVVTVLRARRGKALSTAVAEQLLQSREVEFVPCSDLFLDALATFRREEAPLSFADAAIATVARRDRHGYVATFDKDFRNVPGVTVIPS
ncbi:MAG TPA: PIN domain-containing protein [Gemmatimonadaceae bacterium]|nr:PIN domain-containing protein [Gemmatimonadaceae bacterium]